MDDASPLVRRATLEDVEAIVRLIASRYEALPDEILAAGSPLDRVPDDAGWTDYEAAFARVDRDPNQLLLVAASGDSVVGTLQLTFIPYLAYRGGTVAMIEVFVVDARLRSQGIGEAMVRACEETATARGCFRLQLTTNKARKRAHAFYERLGFRATHEGYKKSLAR